MNAPRTPSRRLAPAAAMLTMLGAALVGAIAIAGAGDGLLDALLQRPSAARGTVVVPDRHLRQWDPVTVFFDSNQGQRGPEDRPERLVAMNPSHPGAWQWLDARTLQFRPAEPWPPLSTWSFGASGATTNLATLMAPPSQTEPFNGQTGLDPVESITLVFPTPIPTEMLARMIDVELRPLPGIGSGPVQRLARDDFSIKELERTDARSQATYTLVLDHPIPLGTRATVRFGLSLDEGTDEAVSQLTFATAEPFRAVSIGCDGGRFPISPDGTRYPGDQPLRCGAGTPSVHVDFSATPMAIGPIEGRNLVRFDPAVEDLAFRSQGDRLVVTGRFDRETPYRVSVAPTGIVDGAGRPLEITGESAVTVYFPHRPSYLRWGNAQGIAELHGPKMLPLEGRGHRRADLRVYRVDPLNRNFWPFPEQALTVDESARPPGPGEEPEDWTRAEHLPPNALAQRLAGLGSPGISTLVDLPLRDEGGAATFGLDLAPHLERLSGRARPGHYLVGLRRLDESTERSWMRVQVTDLSLTTIEDAEGVRFVVNSLSTGAPVAGAQVRVDAAVSDSGSYGVETVVTGRTGADGAFSWRAPGATPRRGVAPLRITVTKGDDVLLLDPSRPPQTFSDNHWRRSWDTWLQWAWQPLDGRVEAPRELCHVFTERPVYRPEEPIHVRGWLRSRYKGQLTPLGGTGTVQIRGPGGAEWWLPVEVTKTGGFYAKWDEEPPSTGTFTATYWTSENRSMCQVSFQVEAYVLPTFEVGLHGSDDAALDAPFDVKLAASYYAGGRVADRPVRWRVTQYPYTWTPEAREGFIYSSDGRFSRNERFESTPTVVREGRTDEQGQAVLQLDPTIEPTAQPRTYVVEATVTGADDQTVTATHRVHAVPAFVLGLDVPRYLEKATAIRPRILVAGPDGALIGGQEVTVRLLRREWHSHLQASDFSDGAARYITDVVEASVAEQTIRSGTEPVRLELPIDRAGVYVVEVESRDRLGRVQVVSVDLYAGGDEPVAWDKPKAGVFELTADAASHAPGQVAQILVKSPFQDADALVVIEDPNGNRYERVKVRGGKATIRVPIEKTWVPRVPVHVVLHRGRTAAGGGASEADVGKPQTVASTLWLAVEPVENTVAVALEHPERALPGQEIELTVRLRDNNGAPLSGEVTLWLVDQAVLALRREQRLDPLPDFITDRRARTTVRDTRNLSFGRIPLSEMPGGDDGEEAADSGDPLDNATVRKNFKPVPYYEPSIHVGASGAATVRVQLPDNLTRFKVRAKVASGDERFGFGTSEIKVRLPVLVQPALPRFVRPGDAFEATAIGRIVEGDGGPGAAQIAVEGLTLQGDARRSLTWGVTAERIAFPVTVPTPPVDESGRLSRADVQVKIGVNRAADGAADAFEVRLPLRDDRSPVYLREIVALTPGAPVEVAGIPEQARAGSVRRSVVIAEDPSLVRMAGALDFLLQAPVGNTEQRLARARAFLALGRFRAALGMLEAQEILDHAVEDTLDWLPGVIDGQGNVANWPGSRGSVFLTAGALSFAVEAREAGYPVDAPLVAALTRELQKALRSDYRYFIDGASWMERTLALEALASTGAFEGAYWSELARNADYLGTEGVSKVVLASARAGQGSSTMTQALAGRVADDVLVRLYQGKETYGGLQQSRTHWSPLILPSETRTVAAMTRALARVRPSDPKLPFLADALVQLGKEDGWGNTNTNSAALLALSERLDTMAGGAARVRVGADVLALSKGEPVASRTSMDGGPLTLTLESGAQAVALVTTRYTPAPPGSAVAPGAAGFVVERELLRQTAGPAERLSLGDGGQTLSLALGDVIEEHVRVVNPDDRHYIEILVPLAAGMEPLNPRLATAPPEAAPKGRNTREPAYTAYLDDRVAYYFESLPKGTYDFYFRTRATTPGAFVQPPATSTMMYQPEVRGQSAGVRVEVGSR